MSKRKKNVRKSNKKELIVAVDVGQTTHVGYWRVPGGGPESAPFPFANTRAGFAQFLRTIRAAQRQQQMERLVVGFESTGPYGHPLLHYLHDRQVPLVQVNPMHTKRLQELPDNSPLKDDAKDPEVIATLIELGHTLTVVVPAGVAADIRALVRARASVQGLQVAEQNRLHGLLSMVFPEFLTVMKGVTSHSAQYLLTHYPTPPALVAAGVQQLTAAVRRVSRGRLGGDRMTALVQAATQTIGVRSGQAGQAVAITQCVERLQGYARQLTALEDQLAALLDQLPELAVLFSLKGVGLITVATLVGEVGALDAFPSQATLLKFVGLNLYELSSGQRKGQRRISKRGSCLVRRVLYLAAVNMTRSDGIFYAYAQRLRERGKSVRATRTAVMRKLLGVMYALVRDQREYHQMEEIAKAA